VPRPTTTTSSRPGTWRQISSGAAQYPATSGVRAHADGLRGSRRVARRARRQAATELAAIDAALAERHADERRRAWARTARAASSCGSPSTRTALRAVPRPTTTTSSRPGTRCGRASRSADPHPPPRRSRARSRCRCVSRIRRAVCASWVPVSGMPTRCRRGCRSARRPPGRRQRQHRRAPRRWRRAVRDAHDHGGATREVRVEAVSAGQALTVAGELAARAAQLGQRIDGAVAFADLPAAAPSAGSLATSIGSSGGEAVVVDLVADGPHRRCGRP
jgi:hypothetical protein